MNDEIIAISPDTVFISGTVMTEQDALNAVDTVLSDLQTDGSLANVDTAIDTLLGLQRLSGKSLAKLLYGTKMWWKDNRKDFSFKDHMESRHGLKGVTIDRYVTVWEAIETKSIPEAVASRPMRELIPIAKTLSHGYDISDKQWKDIIKANGLSEIGNIIRKVTKKNPKKNSQQIYLERDFSLTAWKDNKRKFIGWMDKELYNSDPDAKKAIDRILDRAGVIRK